MKTIQVTAVLLIVILIVNLLNYVLVDDSESYLRVTMHEMYNQENNIDSLFLGSSHCEWGINPAIMDEILEQNTFNAGSAWQNLDRSYALLKEVGKTNKIQNVYIDMYYVIRGYEDYAKNTPSTGIFLVSDHMKFSWNKCSLIMNSCLKDEWINAFFPARRNWEEVFDLNVIEQNICKKQSEKYKTYQYPSFETEKYCGKGYVEVQGYKELFIKKGHNQPIPDNILSDEDKKYLKKIIEYCEKNHINLVFFSTPMPDYTISDIGNYDYYVKQIKEFLGEIPYYDFNLMDYEKWDIEDKMFCDDNHLNSEGARKFTNIFANFLAGNISEKELFFESYNTKQEKSSKRFLGLVLDIVENDETMNIKIESIGEEPKKEFYYSVYYKKYDDEYMYPIQVMDTNTSFVVYSNDVEKIQIKIYEDCNDEYMITSFETEIEKK